MATRRREQRIPSQAVERLCLYRRILLEVASQGRAQVFSHELAGLAGQTAVMVRRDLMAIGYSGSPNRGYDVPELARALGEFLDGNQVQRVALVGVGNLGRALLDYFRGLRPRVEIAAAFDADPQKVGRVIAGTRVHPLDRLEAEIAGGGIRAAILAVPANAAQEAADRLTTAGILSLLNFTHVRLRVPAGARCEDIDLGIALEKVVHHAHRLGATRREA